MPFSSEDEERIQVAVERFMELNDGIKITLNEKEDLDTIYTLWFNDNGRRPRKELLEEAYARFVKIVNDVNYHQLPQQMPTQQVPLLSSGSSASHSMNVTLAHVTQSNQGHGYPVGSTFTAIQSYAAQNQGELSLSVGDAVTVVEAGAYGWGKGRLVNDGTKQGLFPYSCVFP